MAQQVFIPYNIQWIMKKIINSPYYKTLSTSSKIIGVLNKHTEIRGFKDSKTAITTLRELASVCNRKSEFVIL